jgi:hypothetical protein
MAHLDPDDRRRATDDIDRGDASVGWAPLALVIAFLVLSRTSHRRQQLGAPVRSREHQSALRAAEYERALGSDAPKPQ